MTIDDEGWTERRPTERIPRAARAVTILIVDDDELVLRAIERFHLVSRPSPVVRSSSSPTSTWT